MGSSRAKPNRDPIALAAATLISGNCYRQKNTDKEKI